MASSHAGHNVGPFFPVAAQNPVGKKITGSDGGAGTVSVGRRVAASALDNRGEVSVGSLVAEAPSSSLWLPL